jgi:hypothetical protein
VNRRSVRTPLANVMPGKAAIIAARTAKGKQKQPTLSVIAAIRPVRRKPRLAFSFEGRGLLRLAAATGLY